MVNDYIQRFTAVDRVIVETKELPKIQVYHEDKTWYKQRFRFRINFDFRMHELYAYSGPMIRAFKEIDSELRVRRECGVNVFTSSQALLDYILITPEYLNRVSNVTTSSAAYINEFDKKENAAMDVKMIGSRSYDPEKKYEVVFSSVWENTRRGYRFDDFLREIYDFAKLHKDDLIIPLELEMHFAKEGRIGYYYSTPKLWAKNEDIITLLYMQFDKNISKVYKLIEKVKVTK